MSDFETGTCRVEHKERYVHAYVDLRAVYGTRDTRWHRIRCWWRDRFMPALRCPLMRWRERHARRAGELHHL